MKIRFSIKSLIFLIVIAALSLAAERGRRNLTVTRNKIQRHISKIEHYNKMKSNDCGFVLSIERIADQLRNKINDASDADRNNLTKKLAIAEAGKIKFQKDADAFAKLVEYHSMMLLKYKKLDNYSSAFLGWQQVDPPEPPIPVIPPPPLLQ